MIPPGIPIHPQDSWQNQLRNIVTSGEELLNMLDLRASDVGFSEEACASFALKVPVSFVRRMQIRNPRDPLLLQVLASQHELQLTPGYHLDAVGETGEASPHKGIIHKYRGRVLLVVSGNCAVNCRYCFRRHFPYGENRNSRQQWREALRYIREDDSVEEVILSGGDPLTATDKSLRELIENIAAIKHVRRLRIHSRLPIVIPQRVTEELLGAICHPRLQTIMVVHCNHGNEIDASVSAAVAAVRGRDITVLNQAVLLAGINDSVEAQIQLSEKLFEAGVLPYYLHLLDKVQGAAHFDTPESVASGLIRELASRLPGYLVPRLVKEVAGEAAKIPIPVGPQ